MLGTAMPAPPDMGLNWDDQTLHLIQYQNNVTFNSISELPVPLSTQLGFNKSGLHMGATLTFYATALIP
jgi:hypothetical protein